MGVRTHALTTTSAPFQSSFGFPIWSTSAAFWGAKRLLPKWTTTSEGELGEQLRWLLLGLICHLSMPITLKSEWFG
jgi:hypothetical protein